MTAANHLVRQLVAGQATWPTSLQARDLTVEQTDRLLHHGNSDWRRQRQRVERGVRPQAD